MSVAFRRESDEEHKEPRFELPIPSGPNLVTARGLGVIAARIEALDSQAETATGDHLEAIRRDLRYWHTRRATAQLTTPPADGTAGFGSRVTFTLDGKRRALDLVGDDEADPAAGSIAVSAPLARAIIGAETGERVGFGGRDDAILIEKIEPIDRKASE